LAIKDMKKDIEKTIENGDEEVKNKRIFSDKIL
jgi:hypothetical protein